MSVMLCAIVKNEAPYLIEWVAWHRMIGFDLIAVYDNEFTDATTDLLGRMRRAGLVDAHVPWPSGAHSPQLTAYYDAVRGCPSDWLMCLDADEFLMLKQARNVNDFLDAFAPDVSCIGVNWRVFGSSGQTDFSPRPVMERFRRASTANTSANLHIKSVFRPKLVTSVHMHTPKMASGRTVLANGAPLEMEEQGIANAVDWSVAQINHYFCKSRGEYLFKRARGRASLTADDPGKFAKYTDDLFDHHDLNDELDDSADRYLPDIGPACADLRRQLGYREPLKPGGMPGDMIGHET